MKHKTLLICLVLFLVSTIGISTQIPGNLDGDNFYNLTNWYNITADFFEGDGSKLTGIVATATWIGNATSNLNMRNFDIYNATNVNATTFYGDGSQLTGISKEGNFNGSADQNLNMNSYNITNTQFYDGQPLDGSIGSGIIWADQFDSSGQINVTHVGSTLSYPAFTIRISGTDTSVKYCNFSAGTIEVRGEVDSTFWVDDDCLIENDTAANYFSTHLDLQDGKEIAVFHAMAHDGDIETHAANPILSNEWILHRMLSFWTDSLKVVEGLDVTLETFPNITQTAGRYIYDRYAVQTTKQNISAGAELELVYRVGGVWTTEEMMSGLNLTHCDDGTDLIVCTGNQYRRYFIFNLGYDGDTDDTEIHQLAADEDTTYPNLPDCLNTETNPISFEIPDFYQYTAVVHHAYCAKSLDVAWRDGFIDLRTGATGIGAVADTSGFLTKDGQRPLIDNWVVGGYNITGIDRVNADEGFINYINTTTLYGQRISLGHLAWSGSLGTYGIQVAAARSSYGYAILDGTDNSFQGGLQIGGSGEGTFYLYDATPNLRVAIRPNGKSYLDGPNTRFGLGNIDPEYMLEINSADDALNVSAFFYVNQTNAKFGTQLSTKTVDILGDLNVTGEIFFSGGDVSFDANGLYFNDTADCVSIGTNNCKGYTFYVFGDSFFEGNVTATYLLGDGSELIGISEGNFNGTMDEDLQGFGLYSVNNTVWVNTSKVNASESVTSSSMIISDSLAVLGSKVGLKYNAPNVGGTIYRSYIDNAGGQYNYRIENSLPEDRFILTFDGYLAIGDNGIVRYNPTKNLEVWDSSSNIFEMDTTDARFKMDVNMFTNDIFNVTFINATTDDLNFNVDTGKTFNFYESAVQKWEIQDDRILGKVSGGYLQQTSGSMNLYGGDTSGDVLYLYGSSADAFPNMIIDGNADIQINWGTGNDLLLRENSVEIAAVNATGIVVNNNVTAFYFKGDGSELKNLKSYNASYEWFDNTTIFLNTHNFNGTADSNLNMNTYDVYNATWVNTTNINVTSLYGAGGGIRFDFNLLGFGSFIATSDTTTTEAFTWSADSVTTSIGHSFYGLGVTDGTVLNIYGDSDEMTDDGRLIKVTSGTGATIDVFDIDKYGMQRGFSELGRSRHTRTKHLGASEMANCGGTPALIFSNLAGRAVTGWEFFSGLQSLCWTSPVDWDWDTQSDVNITVRIWLLSDTFVGPFPPAVPNTLSGLLQMDYGQPPEIVSGAGMTIKSQFATDVITFNPAGVAWQLYDLHFVLNHDLMLVNLENFDTVWYKLSFLNLGLDEEIDAVVVSDTWIFYESNVTSMYTGSYPSPQ